MTVGPIQVSLNGLIIDEDTASASGAVWVPTSLDGWFDTPTGALTMSNRQPLGETVTVARAQSRSIAMEVIARHPVDGARLADFDSPDGDTVFRAMDEIKRAMSGALFAPVLLQVVDPLFTDGLQALVRLAQPMRMRVDGDQGFLTVQLPLIAPDPRRASIPINTQSLSPGSNTVTNQGDMSADHQLEAAAGSNPTFQNTTASGSPTLGITGSGDVVINTGSEDVSIDGTPNRPALTTAQWWQLLPGDNTIVVSDSCTISWQDCYS